MSEFTKGEQEFLNILMNAWANGWMTGINGDRTDDKKHIDCPIIMARYPVQAAAPQLLEACQAGVLAINCLLESINAVCKAGKIPLIPPPPLDGIKQAIIDAGGEVYETTEQAEAAIAAAV